MIESDLHMESRKVMLAVCSDRQLGFQEKVTELNEHVFQKREVRILIL